jgi:hypothetical protein
MSSRSSDGRARLPNDPAIFAEVRFRGALPRLRGRVRADRGLNHRLRRTRCPRIARLAGPIVANRGVSTKNYSIGCSKMLGKIRGIDDEDDDEYENDTPPDEQELIPTGLQRDSELGECAIPSLHS